MGGRTKTGTTDTTIRGKVLALDSVRNLELGQEIEDSLYEVHVWTKDIAISNLGDYTLTWTSNSNLVLKPLKVLEKTDRRHTKILAVGT